MTLEERDFFKDRFSEAEIRELLGGRSASEIFSWRSPSFKAMGLDTGGLGDNDLVRLMLQEPRLIRRPMIKLAGELIVGFDKKALDQAL